MSTTLILLCAWNALGMGVTFFIFYRWGYLNGRDKVFDNMERRVTTFINQATTKAKK